MPANSIHTEDLLNNNDFGKDANFPYKITSLPPEINKKILSDFTGERTEFVQVGPEKYLFPSGYRKEAENYYNFQVRPDDVWITTFPRSGTTWTQEMVWLIANDYDYDAASKIPLTERFPFLEFSIFIHPETKSEFLKDNSYSEERLRMIEEVSAPAWKSLSNKQEGRFVKTHLPISLLPPNLLTSGCKVIYVARNPKDVAVSYYHLSRLIRTQGFYKDFPTFWDNFENNLVAWAPYWAHLEEGWKNRHSENLLFVFYEQLNKNLRISIEKVANFLGKSITEAQLNHLENHLKIENFRKNNSVNFDALKYLNILNNGEQGFVRKGKNGGWKDDFSPELEKRANRWITENLKKTDLRFPL